MSWRSAFLRQAASDEQIRALLIESGAPACHRLHYLQMVTEKLAKALLTAEDDPNPPQPVHVALVPMLQSLKTSPYLRRRLGYADAAVFRRYVQSLLDTASQVQALAPSSAGFTRPNPEYPWLDPATDAVVAPADFGFDAFGPRDPRMARLELLVGKLLRIFTPSTTPV